MSRYMVYFPSFPEEVAKPLGDITVHSPSFAHRSGLSSNWRHRSRDHRKALYEKIMLSNDGKIELKVRGGYMLYRLVGRPVIVAWKWKGDRCLMELRPVRRAFDLESFHPQSKLLNLITLWQLSGTDEEPLA